MKKQFVVVSQLITHSFKRFNDTGCAYRAAALSFTTLLSLMPLMTLGFSILAQYHRFKKFSEQIQDFIFSNFLVSSGRSIQLYLNNFVAQANQLSIISLLFLIITATMMMFTLEQTLNSIWKTEKRRHWTLTALLYWTALLFIPILIGFTLFLSSQLILPLIKAGVISKPFLVVLPFFLSIFAFTFLYTLVPHCAVPFRYGFIGALIASFLFEGAKYLFSLYIHYFPTYKIIFGPLAASPLFLVWIYICWTITLVGAIISYTSTSKFSSSF
ncbi:MAG: YihY family inner membrane protein [Rickettsiella sp.]|nr:YihY family inner membrane protein [Rickettsiella sp.]